MCNSPIATILLHRNFEYALVKDYIAQGAEVKITKMDDWIDEHVQSKDAPVMLKVVIVKDDREVVTYLDSQQIDIAFHAEHD